MDDRAICHCAWKEFFVRTGSTVQCHTLISPQGDQDILLIDLNVSEALLTFTSACDTNICIFQRLVRINDARTFVEIDIFE